MNACLRIVMWACLGAAVSLGAAADVTPPSSHLQCGLHCLYISLVALDVDAALGDVEKRLGPVQTKGYSLADLQRVAESYGLKTLAAHTTLEHLAARRGRFACIAHIRGTHFLNVISVNLEAGIVRVIDPPKPAKDVPIATFVSQWGGDVLLIAIDSPESEASIVSRAAWWNFSQWAVYGLLLIITGATVFLVHRRGRRQLRDAPAVSLVVLLLLTGCRNNSPSTSDTAPPSLLIQDTEVDFGELAVTPSGTPITLAIRNREGETLNVETVQTGCGCAVVKLIPREIPPGGERHIELLLRTASVEDRTALVTIRSNDPILPVQTVRLHWSVRGELEIQPASWNAGTLMPSVPRSTVFNMISRGREPDGGFEIVSGPGLTVGTCEPIDTGVQQFEVTIQPAEDPGEYRQIVTVKDGPRSLVHVPVTWTVASPIDLVPSRAYLGICRPGDIQTVSISILTRDGQSIESIGCRSDGGSFQQIEESVRQADGRMVVSLRFQAPHSEGVFREEIEILLNDSLRTRLPVSGIVKEPVVTARE